MGRLLSSHSTQKIISQLVIISDFQRKPNGNKAKIQPNTQH